MIEAARGRRKCATSVLFQELSILKFSDDDDHRLARLVTRLARSLQSSAIKTLIIADRGKEKERGRKRKKGRGGEERRELFVERLRGDAFIMRAVREHLPRCVASIDR